ncbi:MAG: TraB/GumN family protein [Caulobacteraceae bacterium]|nr:TraB/GumN family protein [Caulobacteraceae bacterium]
MVRFLRLTLAVLVVALCCRAAAAQPPVWVVKGPDATIVLFGSVHLLPPGLAWEPARLEQALAQADDVWFEIPIDEASSLAAGQSAIAMGMQPFGRSLSAELSAQDQVRLARAAQACGLPVDGLNRLQPWLADVTLSVASYRLAGAVVDNGVERQLSAHLAPDVQRHAFETPQEQIGYMSSAPVADQVASLRETLGEVEQGPASYQRLLRAWMSGDAGAIRREALSPMMREAPGVYRRLVVDRNRRWMDAILARLHGKGEAVMVVGVGHLVGPDGLPALLRARGIKVQGP